MADKKNPFDKPDRGGKRGSNTAQSRMARNVARAKARKAGKTLTPVTRTTIIDPSKGYKHTVKPAPYSEAYPKQYKGSLAQHHVADKQAAAREKLLQKRVKANAQTTKVQPMRQLPKGAQTIGDIAKMRGRGGSLMKNTAFRQPLGHEATAQRSGLDRTPRGQRVSKFKTKLLKTDKGTSTGDFARKLAGKHKAKATMGMRKPVGSSTPHMSRGGGGGYGGRRTSGGGMGIFIKRLRQRSGQ
jgi:hypothetical protein